jgi:2-dehydro-3-deoxyphosphogluconate aldolase/(4S)-4-hydroxy-2-oxoglutarate aldolase
MTPPAEDGRRDGGGTREPRADGPLLAALRAVPLLPVLRSADPDAALEQIGVLRAAGLPVIELTTSIPHWQAALRATADRWPELLVGVGTVTTPHQADQAVQSGARFLVSPWPSPDVRPVAAAAGVDFLEGGFTPAEVAAAAGRGIAKLFPAHVGGPAYLRSLLAVLPGARIIPTGGIRPADAADYLRAGAVAVGVGSALAGEADLPARIAAIRAVAAEVQRPVDGTAR